MIDTIGFVSINAFRASFLTDVLGLLRSSFCREKSTDRNFSNQCGAFRSTVFSCNKIKTHCRTPKWQRGSGVTESIRAPCKMRFEAPSLSYKGLRTECQSSFGLPGAPNPPPPTQRGCCGCVRYATATWSDHRYYAYARAAL
ncbi:hypothetical protein TNCV_1134771 [Trichonephila clavipes]|nr:hypothetical protein TNCV_1134771 [Trichonephila clavipes]